MALSIANIDHVVLKVQNMDRALAFYTGLLGCKVERTVERLGLVQMRAGACMIDLVPADGPVQGPNMDHFCIRIEPWDARAIRRELETHGVEAPEPVTRYGAEGDGPSIYIEDPDGNVVELKGPPDANA
ncbi:MAG: VOC family protein [Minwuia sp.]|uniref:VOC family protein n=1 Tax=Minwuia sp. TaxID=2493630 RepID=UPI003A89EEE3